MDDTQLRDGVVVGAPTVVGSVEKVMDEDPPVEVDSPDAAVDLVLSLWALPRLRDFHLVTRL